MVEADVARDPLQPGRKLVVGAAGKRGLDRVPVRRFAPSRTDRTGAGRRRARSREAGDELRRDEDGEVGFQSDRESEEGDGDREGQVVEQDAPDPQGLPVIARRQAVHHEEEEERAEHEEDYRITVGPILEALEEGASPIFVDRHRPHVADASAIEVARGRMMKSMGVAPFAERREGQEAEEPADPIPRRSRLHEGAVGAIVEQDEGPHHQGPRGDAEQESYPYGAPPAYRPVHQGEDRPVGQQGIQKLYDGLPRIRPRVGPQELRKRRPVDCAIHARPPR